MDNPVVSSHDPGDGSATCPDPQSHLATCPDPQSHSGKPARRHFLSAQFQPLHEHVLQIVVQVQVWIVAEQEENIVPNVVPILGGGAIAVNKIFHQLVALLVGTEKVSSTTIAERAGNKVSGEFEEFTGFFFIYCRARSYSPL